MILLGQMQTLTVCRSTENGVYLESKTEGTPSVSTDTAAIEETEPETVSEGGRSIFPMRTAL